MYTIGIDVGGTNLKAGLVNESFDIVATKKMPLVWVSPEKFAEDLCALAAALVEEKDGSYVWKKNPFAVLEKIGGDLVESTVSMSRSLGNNPQSVGKEPNIWKTLYMTVAFETMA